MDPLANSLDIPFQVPFVHRLRFTNDVLGQDAEILEQVLEPTGDRQVRVQLWLEFTLV